MEKVKKKKSLTESRSFKTEIMMFVIFMSVGVATVLFKVDGWLSLAMLGIGLLSLYFNNVNKILDFIISCAVCHHILNMQSLLRESLIL